MLNLRQKALEFIEEKPDYQYRLVVGTDSQPKNGHGVDFVTAIVVHRVGYGGIYFWKRIIDKKSYQNLIFFSNLTILCHH